MVKTRHQRIVDEAAGKTASPPQALPTTNPRKKSGTTSRRGGKAKAAAAQTSKSENQDFSSAQQSISTSSGPPTLASPEEEHILENQNKQPESLFNNNNNNNNQEPTGESGAEEPSPVTLPVSHPEGATSESPRDDESTSEVLFSQTEEAPSQSPRDEGHHVMEEHSFEGEHLSEEEHLSDDEYLSSEEYPSGEEYLHDELSPIPVSQAGELTDEGPSDETESSEKSFPMTATPSRQLIGELTCDENIIFATPQSVASPHPFESPASPPEVGPHGSPITPFLSRSLLAASPPGEYMLETRFDSPYQPSPGLSTTQHLHDSLLTGQLEGNESPSGPPRSTAGSVHPLSNVTTASLSPEAREAPNSPMPSSLTSAVPVSPRTTVTHDLVISPTYTSPYLERANLPKSKTNRDAEASHLLYNLESAPVCPTRARRASTKSFPLSRLVVDPGYVDHGVQTSQRLRKKRGAENATGQATNFPIAADFADTSKNLSPTRIEPPGPDAASTPLHPPRYPLCGLGTATQQINSMLETAGIDYSSSPTTLALIHVWAPRPNSLCTHSLAQGNPQVAVRVPMSSLANFLMHFPDAHKLTYLTETAVSPTSRKRKLEEAQDEAPTYTGFKRRKSQLHSIFPEENVSKPAGAGPHYGEKSIRYNKNGDEFSVYAADEAFVEREDGTITHEVQGRNPTVEVIRRGKIRKAWQKEQEGKERQKKEAEDKREYEEAARIVEEYRKKHELETPNTGSGDATLQSAQGEGQLVIAGGEALGTAEIQTQEATDEQLRIPPPSLLARPAEGNPSEIANPVQRRAPETPRRRWNLKTWLWNPIASTVGRRNRRELGGDEISGSTLGDDRANTPSRTPAEADALPMTSHREVPMQDSEASHPVQPPQQLASDQVAAPISAQQAPVSGLNQSDLPQAIHGLEVTQASEPLATQQSIEGTFLIGLTSVQRQAMEEEIERRAQEKIAAQSVGHTKPATPPKVRKQRRPRPPSPDEIPNPVEGGFGMDLNYFGSTDTDEFSPAESPSKKRDVERAELETEIAERQNKRARTGTAAHDEPEPIPAQALSPTLMPRRRNPRRDDLARPRPRPMDYTDNAFADVEDNVFNRPGESIRGRSQVESTLENPGQRDEAPEHLVKKRKPITPEAFKGIPEHERNWAGHFEVPYSDSDEDCEPSTSKLSTVQKGKGKAAEHDEATGQDSSTQSEFDPDEVVQPGVTRGMLAAAGISPSRFKEPVKIDPMHFKGGRGKQGSAEAGDMNMEKIYNLIRFGEEMAKDDQRKEVLRACGKLPSVEEEEDPDNQIEQGRTEHRKDRPADPTPKENVFDARDVPGHSKPNVVETKGNRPANKTSSSDIPAPTASSSKAPATKATSSRTPVIEERSRPSPFTEDEDEDGEDDAPSGISIKGRASRDNVSQGAVSDSARTPVRTAESSSIYESEIGESSSRGSPRASSSSAQPPKPSRSQQTREEQTTTLAPPPAPTPAHAVLPSYSAPQSNESEALTRARAQATRYTPKQPSGLRAASRLSTSTVASTADLGDNKAESLPQAEVEQAVLESRVAREISGNEYVAAVLDISDVWKKEVDAGVQSLLDAFKGRELFELGALEMGEEEVEESGSEEEEGDEEVRAAVDASWAPEDGAQALLMFEHGLSSSMV